MVLSKLPIRKIRKFYNLSVADKCLLSKSLYLLLAVRLMLRMVSFRKILLRMEEGRGIPFTGTGKRPPLPKIAWAVETAGRSIPGTTCLYKALASKVLLTRYGYEARLRIGVDKKERSSLDAHAWVEIDGHLLIGGMPDLTRFTPLLP